MPLLKPDPYGADHQPLKQRIVDKLLRGEFVAIGELLRAKRVAPTSSASKHIGRVGHLSLSIEGDSFSAAAAAKRTVSTPLDYLEAYVTALLPAQMHLLTASIAAPPDSVQAEQLERMRQLVVFASSAVLYFRKFAKSNQHYGHIVNHLEQQRQSWHDGTQELLSPEPQSFMSMTHYATAPPAPGNGRQGDGNPPKSDKPGSRSTRRTTSGQEVCLLWQTGKCKYQKCRFAHVCITCLAEGHASPKCTATPSGGN